VIRVAVDAMGGDRGPEEIVAGALDARTDDVVPVLVGPRGLDTHGLELIEASDVIAMDEKPTDAVRGKPESSLVRACRAVGAGDAQAVVSAGNTGAMLAACLLEIRRLRGVRRPAIAVTIPSRAGATVLLDSGANADARPEDLLQFAHMGAVFAEEILDVRNPEIRLLSIGEEAEKGNQLAIEAHELLAASDLNFTGNTEGRDLLRGGADVVVTDGFTGNVALKLLEGTINTDGGAYLLGLRGLAVIAHGNSSRRAITSAVRLAARGVEHDVVGRLAQRLGDTVLESATPTTPTPT
jgi:glycerol-3-phosphate acyltransferase PlsX